MSTPEQVVTTAAEITATVSETPAPAEVNPSPPATVAEAPSTQAVSPPSPRPLTVSEAPAAAPAETPAVTYSAPAPTTPRTPVPAPATTYPPMPLPMAAPGNAPPVMFVPAGQTILVPATQILVPTSTPGVFIPRLGLPTSHGAPLIQVVAPPQTIVTDAQSPVTMMHGVKPHDVKIEMTTMSPRSMLDTPRSERSDGTLSPRDPNEPRRSVYKDWQRDASNELSFQKLCYEIEHAHPRIHIVRSDMKGTALHPICGMKTGAHLCCGQNSSDMTRYGVGITLYFKFLKFMAALFFFMGILAIPEIFFNLVGNKYTTATKFGFEYTTVGNLGEAALLCSKSQFTGTPTMTFTCTAGTLSSIQKIGLLSGSPSCPTDPNDLVTDPVCSDLKLNTTAYNADFDATCLNKVSCTLPVSTTWLGSSCASRTSDYIFMVPACSDDYITIPVVNQDIKKSTLAVVVVILDVLGIAIFLLLIRWLQTKEAAEVGSVDMDNVTAGDYTVEVTNLPPHESIDHLKMDLWQHFETVLSSESSIHHDLPRVCVADIQLGLNSAKLIEFAKESGVMRKRVEFLKGKLRKMQKMKKTEKQMNKVMARIGKLEMKIVKKEDQYDQWKQSNKTAATVAYVTFEEEEGVLRCLHAYSGSFWKYVCMKRQRRFMGAKLKIRGAPEPSNIIWENLHFTKRQRAVRAFITFVATLVLLIVSFGFSFLAQYYQKQTELSYPVVNCNAYSGITAEQAWQDSKLDADLRLNIVQCYCASQNIIDALQDDFGHNEYLCRDWLYAVSLVKGLAYLSILIVIFVNTAIRAVLKLLARAEKHHSVTDEYAAAVYKIFIAMFVNTAFLALIINANLFAVGVKFPTSLIFDGPYGDFSDSWYQTVGASIVLTMCINMVAPVIASSVFRLLAKYGQCRDRGCSKDMRKTKKITQREYEAQYMGPEFLLDSRYAHALNTIFVCLLYSSGMPIMLWVAFLSFMVGFWFDKVWFVRFYKTPPQFDEGIAEAVQKVLPWAALFHLAFAVWMFSNNKIFTKNTISSLSDIVNANTPAAASSVFNVTERLTSNQGLLIAAAFVFVAVVLIIRTFLWQYVKAIFAGISAVLGCKKKEREVENLPGYYSTLTQKQLENELAKLEKVKVIAPWVDMRRQKIEAALALWQHKKMDRLMQGVYCYDIDENPKYKAAFAKGETVV
eukprot:GILJ01005359.1.p1 GENE.GILJ01005359.1~~GILJ01005359.1.p1  ORF type:complete len:1183 (+),score=192.60 GILJ01005359.1:83-3631(+)